MKRAKVLALLLCERVTRDADGKTALHGVFDRIITPRIPGPGKVFFVYYKIVVREPCTVGLRVFPLDQANDEIRGDWQDSFSQIGPVQSCWALSTNLFKRPGSYALKLEELVEGAEPVRLTDTLMFVGREGE